MFIDYYKMLSLSFDTCDKLLMNRIESEIGHFSGSDMTSSETKHLLHLTEAKIIFGDHLNREKYDREYRNFLAYNRMSASEGADWERNYTIKDRSLNELIDKVTRKARTLVKSQLFHAVEDRRMMLREVWVVLIIAAITLIGVFVIHLVSY